MIGNICYRLPYRAGLIINYQRVKDLCHFHGDVLAEIPTEGVYLGVFKYVKRSWYFEENTNHVEVWTGAELNVSSNFTSAVLVSYNPVIYTKKGSICATTACWPNIVCAVRN